MQRSAANRALGIAPAAPVITVIRHTPAYMELVSGKPQAVPVGAGLQVLAPWDCWAALAPRAALAPVLMVASMATVTASAALPVMAGRCSLGAPLNTGRLPEDSRAAEALMLQARVLVGGNPGVGGAIAATGGVTPFVDCTQKLAACVQDTTGCALVFVCLLSSTKQCSNDWACYVQACDYTITPESVPLVTDLVQNCLAYIVSS